MNKTKVEQVAADPKAGMTLAEIAAFLAEVERLGGIEVTTSGVDARTTLKGKLRLLTVEVAR